MSLRGSIIAAMEASIEDPDRLSELESIVAASSRAVRYLVGLSYRPEPELAAMAARGIGIAARYHPRLVQKVVRRLVWAMNDESGTNAVSAPAVIVAIAKSRPELLLPMVPDLTRLCASDESLNDGLVRALRAVAASHPDEVGRRLGRDITSSRSGGR